MVFLLSPCPSRETFYHKAFGDDAKNADEMMSCLPFYELIMVTNPTKMVNALSQLLLTLINSFMKQEAKIVFKMMVENIVYILI